MSKQTFFLLGLWAVMVCGASLYMEVKEQQLFECVQNTDGTDTDCEQCYYEVHGYYPN